MRSSFAAIVSGIVTLPRAPLFCFVFFAAALLAQIPQRAAHSAPQTKTTIPALLISDIHFEPFWDPAKVPQLAAAPTNEWRAILSAPPSPDQQQRFTALQQSCRVRGVDTSFDLFDSTLKAMRSHAAGAKFVTISGDLISHGFDCKFKSLFPKAAPDDYRKFVEKTLDYVIDELYSTFPGVPVYAALGNNDSDCGDYRLDARSEFLRATGDEVTKGFPSAERRTAEDSFFAGGYYSVALPAPIENARLLVLDDLFMSKSYSTCAGKADSSAADEQIAWLQQQLTQARAKREKIWVMGHIPPGVDLYSTMKKMGDVCNSQPGMFLSSEKMTDVLAEFGDVVELAVFAHTHMDELRILKTGRSRYAAVADVKEFMTIPDFEHHMEEGPASDVAVKMVSSISPNHGNNPSFTLAQIDPATAALVDYRVFTASNQTGVEAKWTEEYDFARSYHEQTFSSSTVSKIIAGFASDPGVKTNPSQSYIDNFSAGSPSPVLQIFWPQYVCALSNYTAEGFKACVCPAPASH
jgi:sphingomyelin phosphodiesterase acid-like 3